MNAPAYVPAGHGNAADAPDGQYAPALHSEQLVPFEKAWKVPPPQAVHSELLGEAANVPGAQEMGTTAPAEQLEPTGHGEHWSEPTTSAHDARHMTIVGH